MRFLKQSTASQSRAIGPFISDSDFKTTQTGLTIANTDIKLVINGAASANKNSGGGTHRINGVYGITFDATDTATVGEIKVSVVVATALPVFEVFCVVEEAVYDALFAASAPGYVVGQKVDVDTIKTNPVVNGGTLTFPTGATLASTTNITAGTVTTATNLTTNNDKTGYALTSGERTSVADALLDRDMSTGTDSGSPSVRTVRQALRFLRNKWDVAAGTLTVKKEDDSTTSWTATVSTDAAAVPIIGNDPA